MTKLRSLSLALIALGLSTDLANAAICYVSEFASVGDAQVQVARQPASTDQAPITVSGVSAPSAAFGAGTKYVRLNCDVVVSFVFGTAPVATASNARLPTGVVEYFQVVGGQKLAVISNN